VTVESGIRVRESSALGSRAAVPESRLHQTLTIPEFVPPSPGAWELERTHTTRPASRFMAHVFPAAMMRGFAEGTRRYGILLDYLDIAIIHSFLYMCPRPVGAPKSARGTPPRLVFALMRRLHPEIRRRVKRAGAVFRDRLWREDLARWDAEVKPSMQAEARVLAGEDLSHLSTSELASHVRRATAFFERTIEVHHQFNAAVMVPLGDFLAHVTAWTGLPAGEILQTLRGLSPVSAGGAAELAALRRALAADREATALLRSTEAPQALLDGLASRPDPVGSAVRTYLDLVGLRCLGGYDVAERHAREHPDLLVSILRAGLDERDQPAHRAAAEQAVARVRERVPPADRPRFDELLEEARLTYRLRDERVFFGDAVGTGLARRAILEAGARLAAKGRVRNPADLVDATPDEIVELLEGRGPTAEELTARVRYREETPITAAPARLGFPPSGPPPAEWLPRDAARLQRAVDIMLATMFVAREGQSSARHLKGFGASPGVYEGPARVVADVGGLSSVQPGEVLVTTSTGPTFNVVLPLIGAIVTERGGALSHAAIVAREYGLPATVGCVGATGAVRTGMRVRVDGEKGELWILD
jgi:pyruvate,water dikinase